MKTKSVVLLSGGMDSAVAYYWAKENTNIRRVLFFDYHQHGADHEWDSVRLLVGNKHFIDRVPMVYPGSIRSTLLLGRDHADYEELPQSFVPARNLTFISIAGAVAFELDAEIVVGGWNQVDVDYPDCSDVFLRIAQEAVNEALGLEPDDITIHSPVLNLSKTAIVRVGEEMSVPWVDTRSCYASSAVPCLKCDSCMKRLRAFLEAGVRDPVVPDSEWNRWLEDYAENPLIFEHWEVSR